MIEQFEKKNLLDVLFQLVDSPQCSQVVINHVIDMVFNLVSFADFVEEDDNEDGETFVTRRLPFKLDFVRDHFEGELTGNIRK